MEIEGSQPVVAKKLWNILRVLFFMLRKGKIIGELHLLLKRGKLAGKALVNNLILHHHYASFTCRSHHNTFIAPRDYEFSCSNSPAIPIKRNYKHYHFFSTKTHQYDDVSTFAALQNVIHMLNNESNNNTSSPLVSLPGFGNSPIVRQLRVTDSPFPLKDEEGDSRVDVAAEEFIKKFYKDLNLQKRMAALESPYHDSWDR